jgi:hypothetical protein
MANPTDGPSLHKMLFANELDVDHLEHDPFPLLPGFSGISIQGSSFKVVNFSVSIHPKSGQVLRYQTQ